MPHTTSTTARSRTRGRGTRSPRAIHGPRRDGLMSPATMWRAPIAAVPGRGSTGGSSPLRVAARPLAEDADALGLVVVGPRRSSVSPSWPSVSSSVVAPRRARRGRRPRSSAAGRTRRPRRCPDRSRGSGGPSPLVAGGGALAGRAGPTSSPSGSGSGGAAASCSGCVDGSATIGVVAGSVRMTAARPAARSRSRRSSSMSARALFSARRSSAASASTAATRSSPLARSASLARGERRPPARRACAPSPRRAR